MSEKKTRGPRVGMPLVFATPEQKGFVDLMVTLTGETREQVVLKGCAALATSLGLLEIPAVKKYLPEVVDA